MQEPTTGEKVQDAAMPRTGRHWQVVIDPAYDGQRVVEACTSYSDFVTLPGTVLKDERRTRIVRIDGGRAPGSGEPEELVLKCYHYSALAGLRTLCAQSKAQREFNGLRICRGLGIPVVEPVAWGVEHTRTGMVRSCFLITRHVPDTVTLRAWLKAKGHADPQGRRLLIQMMIEVGAAFRAMHGAGFFHLRPATKDFLVYSEEEDRLSWVMLDLAYARFMGHGMLARWAQKRDLGILLDSITKYADAEAFDAFWEAYLPDPVQGMPSDQVLQRAHEKEESLLHRNLFSRTERWLKKRRRDHKRDRKGTSRGKEHS
jgi:tRNA A-37 threonylcarbamoyl transferase component Bud32